jgi:hypothetical protein
MAGAPVFQDLEAVIGLTGLKAAGKDELCRMLVPRGFVSRRCSDEIRDELKARGNPNPTVFEMVDMGNLGRAESGDIGYWARRVVATLAGRGCRRIIVNGLRHPAEVDALQDIAGGKLTMVGIVAPTPVRATRFLKRGQAGDPAEYAEFLRLDDIDRGIGQPPHGQQVDRTLARVPWENLYDNSGTLEAYRAWIDALAARLVAVPA